MADFLSHAVRDFLLPGGPYLFVRVITASYAVSAVGRLIPVRRKQVAGYRSRPVRTVAIGAFGVATACGIAACTLVLPAGKPPPSATTSRPSATHGSPQIPAVGKPLEIGVFEPNEWNTWQPVAQFASSIGRDPGVVLLYAGWPGSFNTRFANAAYAHNAVPFVQLMPDAGVTMRQVADGSDDAALRSYANQVRGFGHPVMLSFAPEANGSWYGYGWSHTPAGTWVAAWRHVVTVFRSQGARNVTWVWTMNVSFPHSGPAADYWPGDGYVGEVGIDGYFVRSTDTFSTVFGPILRDVRRLTSKPVIISETAVGSAAGTAPIASLFAGLKAHHISAMVWFDQAQHDGLYHQDWRLEDSKAALAAFRAAARRYGA